MPELTNAERLDAIKARAIDKEVVADDFFFVVGLARGLWVMNKALIRSLRPPHCPFMKSVRPMGLLYMLAKEQCARTPLPGDFASTGFLGLDPLFTLVGANVSYDDAKRYVESFFGDPGRDFGTEQDWKRWGTKFRNAAGLITVIE